MYFNHTSGPLALYVDLLYFIHMPPPASASTYLEFAVHLWNIAIKTYIQHFSVEEIYIVIDKPDFLPPPRTLVHVQRQKGNVVPLCIPNIKDGEQLCYGAEYSSLLGDKEYKAQLNKYLCTKFLEFALTANVPVFVVDSPAFPKVYMLCNGSLRLLPSNEHGEADYAIWYRVIRSSTSNTMILSKDTDTWVYGLALMEQGLMSDKNVLVKLGVSNEYVSINLGVRAIGSLPTLCTIRYPVSCIVALYVLTGCDYVSSFFCVTKQNFLQCFIEHAEYVCTLLRFNVKFMYLIV